MALQLLFKNAIRGTIGALELDAILTETHSRNNKVTSFPVEKGSDITDHIALMPIEFTMEGHITNTPIKYGPENTGLVLSVSTNQSRVAAAYELLKTIFADRALITVVSGLEVYDGMAFVSLSIPRSAATGEVLNFSANFKQVRIVTSESVLLPAAAIPNKAATKTDAGQNSTTEAKETTAQKAQSLLSKLAGKAGL